MKRLTLILMLILVSPRELSAKPTHRQKTRVTHIAGALAALKNVAPHVLANAHNYFYTMARNKCRSSSASLRVNCLLATARQSCTQIDDAQRRDCSLIADVIITNRLSERRFITTRRRYEIMKEHSDYKKMLLKELRRSYAALATELGMSQPEGAHSDYPLAPAIDSYCLQVAGSRELSWQSCVAAIVWFIGTSEIASEDRP